MKCFWSLIESGYSDAFKAFINKNEILFGRVLLSTHKSTLLISVYYVLRQDYGLSCWSLAGRILQSGIQSVSVWTHEVVNQVVCTLATRSRAIKVSWVMDLLRSSADSRYHSFIRQWLKGIESIPYPWPAVTVDKFPCSTTWPSTRLVQITHCSHHQWRDSDTGRDWHTFQEFMLLWPRYEVLQSATHKALTLFGFSPAACTIFKRQRITVEVCDCMLPSAFCKRDEITLNEFDKNYNYIISNCGEGLNRRDSLPYSCMNINTKVPHVCLSIMASNRHFARDF